MGGLSVAALAVQLVGWAWVSPFELIDEDGWRWQLLQTGPAALTEGWKEALERAEVARSVANSVAQGPREPGCCNMYFP